MAMDEEVTSSDSRINVEFVPPSTFVVWDPDDILSLRSQYRSISMAEEVTPSRINVEFVPPSSFLVWNPDDILALRSQWRVVPGLIGCSSYYSHQNSSFTPPACLSPEAVFTLLTAAPGDADVSICAELDSQGDSMEVFEGGASERVTVDKCDSTVKDNLDGLGVAGKALKRESEPLSLEAVAESEVIRVVTLRSVNRFPTDAVETQHNDAIAKNEREQREYAEEQAAESNREMAERIGRGRVAKRRKREMLDGTPEGGDDDEATVTVAGEAQRGSRATGVRGSTVAATTTSEECDMEGTSKESGLKGNGMEKSNSEGGLADAGYPRKDGVSLGKDGGEWTSSSLSNLSWGIGVSGADQPQTSCSAGVGKPYEDRMEVDGARMGNDDQLTEKEEPKAEVPSGKTRSRAKLLRVKEKDIAAVTVTEAEVNAVLAEFALKRRLRCEEPNDDSYIVEQARETPCCEEPLYRAVRVAEVVALFGGGSLGELDDGNEMHGQKVDDRGSQRSTGIGEGMSVGSLDPVAAGLGSNTLLKAEVGGGCVGELSRNNTGLGSTSNGGSKLLLRCRVFRDLWRRGLFVTGGLKFGCDFLAYPGDPLRFHAAYMVVCVEKKDVNGPLRTLDAWNRVGTQVNKDVVFAYEEVKHETGGDGHLKQGVSKECGIKYITCDWMRELRKL